MKNFINGIGKYVVAGALGIVIFIFSVVPAQADVLSDIQGFIGNITTVIWYTVNGQSATDRQHAQTLLNTYWSGSTSANSYIDCEVSADTLSDLCAQLNLSGFPCKITHNFMGYVICGAGVVEVPGIAGTLATSYTVNLRNKYLHTAQGGWIYSSTISSPELLDSVVGYIDGVEGYLSSLNTKVSNLNSIASYWDSTEHLATLMHTIFNGYFTDDRTQMYFSSSVTTLYDKVSSILTSLNGANGLLTTISNKLDNLTSVSMPSDISIDGVTVDLDSYLMDNVFYPDGEGGGFYVPRSSAWFSHQIMDGVNNIGTVVAQSFDSLISEVSRSNQSLTNIESMIEHMSCHHDYRSTHFLYGDLVSYEATVPSDEVKSLVLEVPYDANGYDEVSIYQTGKNLLDMQDFSDYSNWRNDLYTDSAVAYTSSNNRGFLLSLVPGTTYTFSFGLTGTTVPKYFYLCSHDGTNGTYMAVFTEEGTTLRRSSYTFTAEAGVQYFLRMGSSSTSALFDQNMDCISYVQLERGTAATAYSPYVGHTYTVDLADQGVTDFYGGTVDLTNGIVSGQYDEDGLLLSGVATYSIEPVIVSSYLGNNILRSPDGTITLQITDGSNLTDMGYSLMICNNCGQVQPLLDYTRLFNRLDSMIGSLQNNGATLVSHATATDTSLQTIIELLQDNLSTDTQAHEHIYTRHITQDATCTVPGLATYTCDECGYGYTELLPALGHDWDFTEHVNAVLDENDEVVQPAYDIYTCTRCNHSYQDHDGTGAPVGSDQIGDLITSIFSRLGNLAGSAINGLLSAGDSFLTGLDDLATDFNDKVHQVEGFGGDYPAWLAGFYEALPADLQLALSFCLILSLIGICGKRLVFAS